MRLQAKDHLHKLFINDVDELARLGNTDPRTNHVRLQMSGILRRLVADQHSLATIAAADCRSPLVFLVPEPISGNRRYKTQEETEPAVLRYWPEITEQSHPGGKRGWFYCRCDLSEFLDRPNMVLMHRSITPKEMIKFLANKMGGVHADPTLEDRDEGGRSVDAHTLWELNERVSILGERALYQRFDGLAETIWRSCMPLRDELYQMYGGNVAL